MTSSPYRSLEKGRGPLTFKEKAGAMLSGLKTFEPLLELASRGLDPDLPRDERIKAAGKLAKTTSTSRIYAHLENEKDPSVQESLAYAFVEAYHRKMGEFDMQMCSRYTAMGAQSLVDEKSRYSANTRGLAIVLLTSDAISSAAARSALESMAYGRPQV